ncbi:MAG: hypothetical protein GX114_00015 [Clostridiales bacterium]|nr:hypothetical protein [Clostridiales bacterium]
MGLEINSSFARVGIKRHDALINIKTQPPTLDIKSTSPSVRINTQHVRVDKNPRAIPALAKNAMGKRVDITYNRESFDTTI